MRTHKTRKWTAVLVVAIAASVLFLAGCATPATAPAPKKVTYHGTLVLWVAPGLAGYQAAGPQLGWYQERAAAYEAQHADIKVQVQSFATPADLEQSLLKPDFGGTAAPDLAFGRFLPALQPRLADMGSRLSAQAKADYLPNALAAFQRDGAQFGLPALLDVPVLALNEAGFTAANVALPANGTWSQAEFEESLKKLSGNGRFGLGFFQLPSYHEWWGFAAGLVTPDGRVADGAEAGLNRLASYRSNGWFYPDSGKVNAEATWAAFAKNPPAFSVMPVEPWAVPLLRAEPYSAKVSVAGFPGGITAGYTYGFSFFKQADPSKLDAAIDLAQFMAAPDQQVRLARETALMPARKSAGNPFQGDAAMTAAYQSASGQAPLPAGPEWDRVYAEAHKPLLWSLLGSQKPAEAVAAIQSAISSAMTPANK